MKIFGVRQISIVTSATSASAALKAWKILDTSARSVKPFLSTSSEPSWDLLQGRIIRWRHHHHHPTEHHLPTKLHQVMSRLLGSSTELSATFARSSFRSSIARSVPSATKTATGFSSSKLNFLQLYILGISSQPPPASFNERNPNKILSAVAISRSVDIFMVTIFLRM